MATSACPVCRARFPAGDLKVSVRLRDLVESTAPATTPAEGGSGAMDCCICLERLRDPVTLPCGHDGCLACLNRLPTAGAPLAVAPVPLAVAPVPLAVAPVPLAVAPAAQDHRNRILNPATGRVVLDTAANRRRAAAGPAAARSPSPAAVRARQAWRIVSGLRRQSTWSAAARGRGFSQSAALAYAGGWLAFYFARSVACLAVGMHHLSGGEKPGGWQPWIAAFMMVRELVCLATVIACTWYNPACLLHKPIARGPGGLASTTGRSLSPELYLPNVLLFATGMMPGYSRRTRRAIDLGDTFSSCLILSDIALLAGVSGGLAAGTLPTMLAASHAITSGRSWACIVVDALQSASLFNFRESASMLGTLCLFVTTALLPSYLLCLPDINALPSQHYNAAVGCHAMTTLGWVYVFVTIPYKTERVLYLSRWLLVWLPLTLVIFFTPFISRWYDAAKFTD
jgi:hypothetical protein